MQTRGIPIVVPVLVVVVVGGWAAVVACRSQEEKKGKGEGGGGGEGKECNDSDSDDGGGSFREITGFTGVRLTGASKGERDARWCWAMKGDEGGDMVAHGCIYAHG